MNEAIESIENEKKRPIVEMEFRVKDTLLSRKPAENSGLVAILTVILILFVSALAWRDPSTFNALLVGFDQVFHDGEFWRLLTAIAIHSNFQHFISNAVFLGFFSYLLFGYFGGWVFPVLVVFVGALTNLLSLMTYPDGVRLVGASGLVYVMVGFWLTMYILVERRISLKRRLLHGIGISLIVLLPSTIQENVSYRTHAIGFGLGSLTACGHFHLRKDQIRRQEVLEVTHQEPYWQM